MSHFIVFEGLDGTGKTTQIKLLAEYLEGVGEKVFTTAEPTALPTGKLLRRVLGGEVPSDPWATAALFYSDRIQHCVGEGGIKSHLESGETVITDRYYFSTFAYQGIDTDLDAIMDMHYRCPQLIHPDLVIFLTMSPEDCMKRITANRGAEEIEIYENVASLTKISERFNTVFNMLGNKERVVYINAGGTIEEVAADIRRAVDEAFSVTDKSLLLFDMDGTVFDNSEGIINCIKYSLDKMGRPLPDAETLRKFIGPALFDSYMTFIDKNEEDANTFVQNYRERYAPIGTTEVCLYPGIEQTLRKLKEDGYNLAVVSGKPEPFVIKICRALGIDDIFNAYYCTNFGSHSSDKTSFVRAALGDFNIPASEALMIGDTMFDVAAGHGAGVEVLGVTYGFGKERDFIEEKPDFTTDSAFGIYKTITGKDL